MLMLEKTSIPIVSSTTWTHVKNELWAELEVTIQWRDRQSVFTLGQNENLYVRYNGKTGMFEAIQTKDELG